MRILLFLLLSVGFARAEGETAGQFDYYVLSLSWTPTWCSLEGDARQAKQCDDGAGFGWVLHGLWPQFEQGWPSYCRTGQRDPSRSQTASMADIMGSSGSAWHQWKKHGRCSGLPAEDFFDLARHAYGAVTRPAVFRKLDQTVALPAHVVEQAFLEANTNLTGDMLTVTCKQNNIQEVRICLTRDLNPRICGDDVIRDCQLQNALLAPLR